MELLGKNMMNSVVLNYVKALEAYQEGEEFSQHLQENAQWNGMFPGLDEKATQKIFDQINLDLQTHFTDDKERLFNESVLFENFKAFWIELIVTMPLQLVATKNLLLSDFVDCALEYNMGSKQDKNAPFFKALVAMYHFEFEKAVYLFRICSTPDQARFCELFNSFQQQFSSLSHIISQEVSEALTAVINRPAARAYASGGMFAQSFGWEDDPLSRPRSKSCCF